MHDFLDQVFVYHPTPWIDRNWARISGLPLEDVRFQSVDGTALFGWYVEAPAAPGVLLWCHGNAGNLINRLENLTFLYRIGLSVFVFDYRGFGLSAGRPTEAGLYQDALAAYSYLITTRQVAAKRVVIFGRSLGAAVAGEVASQRPAGGLILESAFPSVAALARAHYYGLPAHLLLVARFDLIRRLRAIHMPVLVIHGDRDVTVPVQLGQQVFEAVREPKELYIVDGADHNDLYQVGGREYFQRLRRFVEDVT